MASRLTMCKKGDHCEIIRERAHRNWFFEAENYDSSRDDSGNEVHFPSNLETLSVLFIVQSYMVGKGLRLQWNQVKAAFSTVRGR